MRGGQRKAGTTRPAARVAAESRRAALANQATDAGSGADTEVSTEIGFVAPLLMSELSHLGVTDSLLSSSHLDLRE